ncbi:helix-turn-helix domain-containing protein [Streptomyces sp. NBC_01264]|uniref:helix-turn-helix domain-containing protein n=1 Tax=Streptomyces sp. NBC_01264 TaxID=2903804 RepID=UPI002256F8F1|nr:helix-turn-helix transcriptional regulator [Streptomyces sp. NBC_01264]MCX4780112.1 helix-turn-helix transcriptional regulator [Streptomyces sp. NBC_01264]
MASNAVIPGPTSKRVAANVLKWRKARQMQQKDLSAALGEIGRPMLPTVISKIERGERRVDADDLVSLAVALSVSPSALLLPTDGDSAAPLTLTEGLEVTVGAAWEWADGQKPLARSTSAPYGDLLRFRLDSRPAWDRDPIRKMYNEALQGPAQREALSGPVDWVMEGDQWVLRTPAGQEVFRGPAPETKKED